VNHATSSHRVFDEGDKAGGRGIGDLAHANAAYARTTFLDGNHDQRFVEI